jgi:hypothetical protein
VLYLLVVLNAIRYFVLCSYTDPGVIPRVRSPKIDYDKAHYVQYAPKEVVTAEDFFSLDRFVYHPT